MTMKRRLIRDVTPCNSDEAPDSFLPPRLVAVVGELAGGICQVTKKREKNGRMGWGGVSMHPRTDIQIHIHTYGQVRIASGIWGGGMLIYYR